LRHRSSSAAERAPGGRIRAAVILTSLYQNRAPLLAPALLTPVRAFAHVPERRNPSSGHLRRTPIKMSAGPIDI
jgi:hypothetical protein